MKKLNTKQILKNFKGEDLKENKESILIGNVLSNVMAANRENPTLSWQLGKKFATESTVELKAEDVVFIKKSIESCATGDRAWLSSMVAGQIIEILESSDTK